MKVHELKEKYPVVYRVFWGETSEAIGTAKGNVGATPTSSTTGYQSFVQMGLKLKERVKNKSNIY